MDNERLTRLHFAKKDVAFCASVCCQYVTNVKKADPKTRLLRNCVELLSLEQTQHVLVCLRGER